MVGLVLIVGKLHLDGTLARGQVLNGLQHVHPSALPLPCGSLDALGL